MMAPYAADPGRTLGRRYSEEPPTGRSDFQRDRDRVIHSKAFRRLEYKTQVFVNHEGDLYRTRLTHSIEVGQIARSIARQMRLNEDLAEAIALAHDLGHTPFGHAGQDALNACMHPYGGFEHNFQSLRVVDELEERYAAFPGLNLCFETREGILKHCSPARAAEVGEVGRRFVQGGQPSLEAQLTNLADEIAYNNHDIDDGLRSGLITLTQLQEIPLFERVYTEVRRRYPAAKERVCVYETIRRLINEAVTDLVQTSLERINKASPQGIEDVYAQPEPLIAYSPALQAESQMLKAFLRRALYRHPEVHRQTEKAKRLVRALFEAFFADVRLLPLKHQQRLRLLGAEAEPMLRARVVADYIAGMTDRFAIAEYRRLFDS